jgi:kynurenine formamidase
MSPVDVGDYYRDCSNWARWGADDELGTLHFLTPTVRAQAMASVRTGTSISLARDLTTKPTPEQPVPVTHHMLASGDALNASGVPGYEATRDYLGSDVHGLGTTHLDALCHIFVEGQMYNGRSPVEVPSTGATRNTVMTMRDGIIGRGVILDISALRDVAFLSADDRVTAEDLTAAETRQAVTVGSGDILVVATGRDARESAGPLNPFQAGLPGLDPSCLPWLHDREVAVLAGDGISDSMPARQDPSWPFPIHQVAIAAMGMPLIDNCRLDELLAACHDGDQWSFLLTICPLRLPGGTGCPVNPVAVL